MSSSPAVSQARVGVLSVVSSCGPSAASSCGPLVASSREPLVASSHEPSVASSHAPSVSSFRGPSVALPHGPSVASSRAPSVSLYHGLSVVSYRAPSIASSCGPSVALSCAPSVALSCTPSVTSSCAPLVASSPEPLPSPSLSDMAVDPLCAPLRYFLQKRAPEEESGLESEAESGEDVVSDGDWGDDGGNDNNVEMNTEGVRGNGTDDDSDSEMSLEGEKETINNFLDAGGAEPKASKDIWGWHKLREQIKSNLELAEKNKAIPRIITQLLILHNFAMLQMKGCGCMAASEDIARQ